MLNLFFSAYKSAFHFIATQSLLFYSALFSLPIYLFNSKNADYQALPIAKLAVYGQN
jgi:hypothetical protein